MREMKKRRKELGYTQLDVAARSGVETSTISRAEVHGFMYPGELARVAKALSWEGEPSELLKEASQDE
ncbi:MAG: helix-turn-helix domain-containing protein [Coriobacteriales bacterium]|jgi:predicted transcriptional regulator